MDDISNSTILSRYKQLMLISNELASIYNLDDLLQQIVQIAVILVKAESASILLYDSSRNELFFEAVTNPRTNSLIRGDVVPFESVAGWVVTHKEAVIIDDPHSDVRFYGHVEKTLGTTTRNLIGIPMITKNKLVGVLEVQNKNQGGFDLNDQEVLSALASQAAVAIENSRLFQQSDLLSELVHEIRTPLTSINAIAYLLQKPNLSDADRTSLSKTIESEAQRLNELTTEFLDFSRLESRRTQYVITRFDLNNLMLSCIDSIQPRADESKISIKMHFDASLPPIEADSDKVKQVIINLLSNAIKYSQRGGRVEVRTWAEGKKIYFSVRDDGRGIPKEDLPFIFEKFFRSKSIENIIPGTGLGLSICKNIIEAHKGKISAASEVGHGTTFTVQLPVRSGM